ncbi:DgyrCDS9091 [Dimorphilus gyrociliatus]|uniref:DgyrCDS9091 n=1 Tax=Dimorphilus gyrociliatus TaxID=2664684 RepID=A0A7I8W1A1_9ANNE|nr:DgyrCDS9091 [Dimorphilus gyrociliatus]
MMDRQPKNSSNSIFVESQMRFDEGTSSAADDSRDEMFSEGNAQCNNLPSAFATPKKVNGTRFSMLATPQPQQTSSSSQNSIIQGEMSKSVKKGMSNIIRFMQSWENDDANIKGKIDRLGEVLTKKLQDLESKMDQTTDTYKKQNNTNQQTFQDVKESIDIIKKDIKTISHLREEIVQEAKDELDKAEKKISRKVFTELEDLLNLTKKDLMKSITTNNGNSSDDIKATIKSLLSSSNMKYEMGLQSLIQVFQSAISQSLTASFDKIRNSLTQTVTTEIRNKHKSIENHFTRLDYSLNSTVGKLGEALQKSSFFVDVKTNDAYIDKPEESDLNNTVIKIEEESPEKFKPQLNSDSNKNRQYCPEYSSNQITKLLEANNTGVRENSSEKTMENSNYALKETSCQGNLNGMVPESEYDSDEIERMSLTQLSTGESNNKQTDSPFIPSSDSDFQATPDINTPDICHERVRSLRSNFRKPRNSVSPELNETYCRRKKSDTKQQKKKISEGKRQDMSISKSSPKLNSTMISRVEKRKFYDMSEDETPVFERKRRGPMKAYGKRNRLI